MATEQATTIILEDLLREVSYVRFHKAMTQNDCAAGNLTADEYALLYMHFKDAMNIKVNATQKQIAFIKTEMQFLANCTLIIPILGLDKETLEILKKKGVNIDAEIDQLVDNIKETLNNKTTEYQLLTGELPQIKNLMPASGEDLIAELSLSVEMKLDSDISLKEYLSYHRAARKKSESLKKSMKNVSRRKN